MDKSIGLVKRNIKFKANINTKYYGKSDEIVNSIEEDVEIEEKGKVLNTEYKTIAELYKGYIQVGSSNKTNVAEELNIEISTLSAKLDEIKLEKNNFINEKNKEYEIKNLYFQNTSINKEEFYKIFNENTTLTVINTETSVVIEELTKDTQTDENGNWNIDYIENIKHISLKVNGEIVNIGTLKIRNNKYFIGSTEYTKNQILSMKNIKSYVQIVSSMGEEEIFNLIELKDTYNEAKIMMEPNTLSTLSKNENINITATLVTNDIKNSLYTNPKIEIILPTEIESIDIKSVYILNTEELTPIKSYKTKNKVGQNVIIIETMGEITQYVGKEIEGIEFMIEADIISLYEIQNGEREIILNITSEEGYTQAKTNFVLKAPTSVVTASSIDEYNLQIVNNEGIKEIEIEEKSKAKQTIVENKIINTNEENMNNVSVIGTLPTDSQENNMGVQLIGTVNVSDVEDTNAKIYYTKNENASADITDESNGWKENIEEVSSVKKYLLELDNIKKGEIVNVTYEIQIPANLNYNQKASQGYSIEYENSNEEIKTIEVDKLRIATQTEAEINVELSNVVGLEGISNVKNGEIITYKINARNIGGKDAKNVRLRAAIPTGTVYVELKGEWHGGEGVAIDDQFIDKYPEKTEIEYTIDIPKGENVEKEYNILVLDTLQSGSEILSKLVSEYEGKTQESNTIIHNVQNGDIKVRLGKAGESQNEIKYGYSYVYTAVVENTSNKDKKDVTLQFVMNNDYLDVNTMYYSNDKEIIGEKEIVIDKIAKNSMLEITFYTKAKLLASTNENMSIGVLVKENENTYHSNSKKIVVYPTDIDISLTTNANGETIIPTCLLTYQIKVTNNTDFDIESVNLTNYISKFEEIVSVKYDGEKIDKEDWETISEGEFTALYFYNKLIANKTIEIEIVTSIDERLDIEKNTKISNKLDLGVHGENIMSQEVYHIVGGQDDDESEEGNNQDDNNPIIPGTNIISGMAWIDVNEDGQKNEEDSSVSGVNVKLVDVNTLQTVVNGNNIKIETQTDNEGVYILKNIPAGQYIVIFEYNTQIYTVTQYKKIGIEESLNSNALVKKLNIDNEEKTVGATEVINVNDSNISNINIGLKYAKKFDLKLDKYISSIVVKQNNSEKLYSFNNTNLAKVEIDSKRINNTQVIVEYIIKISNIGDLTGTNSDVSKVYTASLRFLARSGAGQTFLAADHGEKTLESPTKTFEFKYSNTTPKTIKKYVEGTEIPVSGVTVGIRKDKNSEYVAKGTSDNNGNIILDIDNNLITNNSTWELWEISSSDDYVEVKEHYVQDVKLTNDIIIYNPRTYVDIEGIVFADGGEGKTTTTNALYNNGEGVKNVKVTLKKDGKVVKNANGQNAEITSKKDGKYSFIGSKDKNGFKIELKNLSHYSVEFEYNGMKYEAVVANLKNKIGSKAIDVSGKENKTRGKLNDVYNTIVADSVKYTSVDVIDNKSTAYYDKPEVLGQNEYHVIASTEAAKFNLANADYDKNKGCLQNINFGIVLRDQPNAALVKDVDKATISINGQTHTYICR